MCVCVCVYVCAYETDVAMGMMGHWRAGFTTLVSKGVCSVATQIHHHIPIGAAMSQTLKIIAHK